MNEDFTPFELAVKLKEKKFREPCVATYDKDGMLGYNYYQPKSIKAISFDDCLCISNDLVLAPTISQVLKWLREEKKIHIVIDFDGGMGWYYQTALYGLTTYEKESEHKYNSYEQAALAGIEYVLDNLFL